MGKKKKARHLFRRLRVACKFQARLSSAPAFITRVAMCLSVFTNYGNETKRALIFFLPEILLPVCSTRASAFSL